jgi:hypothetical protein
MLVHRTRCNKTETEAIGSERLSFAARGSMVVNLDCYWCFHSEDDWT